MNGEMEMFKHRNMQTNSGTDQKNGVPNTRKYREMRSEDKNWV